MKKLLTYSALLLFLCGCRFDFNKDHIAEGYEDLKAGKITLAISDFEYALSLDSQKYEAYKGLAACYMHTGDWNKALANINQYLATPSPNFEGYNDRGIIYLYLKEYEKSIADFDKVLHVDSGSNIALFNKASALGFLARHKEARDIYTTLIAADKSDARSYYKRGMARFKNGEIFDACEDYKVAASLGDKDAQREFMTSCK
jgi:tetratricopeptide (TPR) repeat protein